MWCGVVWCGVVWCDAVRCGVVWCGVVWCGVVWCGVAWCGVVRRGVVCAYVFGVQSWVLYVSDLALEQCSGRLLLGTLEISLEEGRACLRLVRGYGVGSVVR